MINKLTKITNDALRQRWSTVAILALILTINRAVLDWPLASSDIAAYIAKLFVTLILSLIISIIIHVLLHAIFSPKSKE